jgi:uncharacterized protein (DUF342 family)
MPDRLNELNQNGTAAIKGGRLIVENPIGNGLRATVTPVKGISCKLNGQIMEHSFPVSAEDVVELSVVEKEHVVKEKIEVKVKNNGLIAEAAVFPRLITSYCLADQPPQNNLTLVLKAVEQKENVIDVNAVEEALQKAGVCYGIDSQAVRELVGTPERWKTVARGKEPVEGRDGCIKYFFDSELKKIEYTAEEKVNYREKYRLPSVKKGELLAVIEPPVPGKPGFSVLGKRLEPRPVKEAVISCRDGAYFDKARGEIYAVTAGRPVLRRGSIPQLKIDPLYIHNSDVDMESGNLSFNGHLKVNGDVKEGMKVHADGDLEIAGNVAGAELIAGENIVVRRNLINCRVKAGAIKDFLFQLEKKWSSFAALLSNLEIASVQLQDALMQKSPQANIKFGSLISFLLEKKFKDYQTEKEELANFIHNSMVTPPYSLINPALEALVDCSVENITKLQSLKELNCLMQKVDFVSENLGRYKSSVPKAIFYYVQNSNIIAGGDLLIEGPGCYNSNITAAGQIIITGVFRGGSIQSGGDVTIAKAGSPASRSDYGKIYVSRGAAVRLKLVYENTRVQIGNRSISFNETRENVKIFVDEHDQIRTIYWSG